MYANDSDLIKACLAGEEAAWKNLVDRYARLVYSVTLAQGMRLEDADHVFQQVFTRTFHHLQNLHDRKRIAAWLIATTCHECQRLHQRTPQTMDLDETPPDLDDLSAEDIQIWERRHIIGQAMQQLESPCREILQALFRDPPVDQTTIAGQLGIPLSNFSTLRARCFKKLETILASMGADLT